MTAVARLLLAAAVALVTVAVLLPNHRLAALRERHGWFSEAINRVEALWPAIDMVHVVMFGAVGLLLALAFPAWRFPRLLLVAGALAGLSECAQIWVPGRTASVEEAALDIASAALGIAVVACMRRVARGAGR